MATKERDLVGSDWKMLNLTKKNGASHCGMNPNDEIRRMILQYFYDRNVKTTS